MCVDKPPQREIMNIVGLPGVSPTVIVEKVEEGDEAIIKLGNTNITLLFGFDTVEFGENSGARFTPELIEMLQKAGKVYIILPYGESADWELQEYNGQMFLAAKMDIITVAIPVVKWHRNEVCLKQEMWGKFFPKKSE